MTGAEHYRKAEMLATGTPDDIAAAQVHATLALAAATALNGGAGNNQLPDRDWTAWFAAAATKAAS